MHTWVQINIVVVFYKKKNGLTFGRTRECVACHGATLFAHANKHRGREDIVRRLRN